MYMPSTPSFELLETGGTSETEQAGTRTRRQGAESAAREAQREKATAEVCEPGRKTVLERVSSRWQGGVGGVESGPQPIRSPGHGAGSGQSVDVADKSPVRRVELSSRCSPGIARAGSGGGVASASRCWARQRLHFGEQ
ncbi:hypothetical protein OH76DRAFT_460114 [Lentinus brumalis]|uniref:Uncharacterized protein n=1 Tax=Lentinus brumalis TaxID=2498619 RepID=A0A371CII3_9APHY|nr:hypothetical protein OH76DRAFT_460114 [Polyporus brumalis]